MSRKNKKKSCSRKCLGRSGQLNSRTEPNKKALPIGPLRALFLLPNGFPFGLGFVFPGDPYRGLTGEIFPNLGQVCSSAITLSSPTAKRPSQEALRSQKRLFLETVHATCPSCFSLKTLKLVLQPSVETKNLSEGFPIGRGEKGLCEVSEGQPCQACKIASGFFSWG